MACFTLMLSMREVKFSGHLQWDSMKKDPTEWINPYKAEECRSWGTIFLKYERNWWPLIAPP